MLKLSLLSLLILVITCYHSKRPVYTQVAFLYNIKRGDLLLFKRDFKYYLDYFEQLLRTDLNMIIFGEQELEDFVWKRRQPHNTIFIRKEIQQFKKYWYAGLVQKVRLEYSNRPFFLYKVKPQYSLEYYNLLMFGKIEVMSEAIRHDRWNTDVLIWTDGGLLHQFSKDIISPDNILKKMYKIIQPQYLLIGYSHDTNIFLGYEQSEARYLNRRTNYYERILASTMGGNIHVLEDFRSAYHLVARITLESGDLDSDQSVLTLLHIKYPFLVPSITNIYMQEFINKVNTYEDVSKIPFFPRKWTGRFDSAANLTVLYNANSSSDHILQASSSSNRRMTQDTFREGEQYEADLMRTFIGQKREADLTILKAKASCLAMLLIVYCFLFLKNKKINRDRDQRAIRINDL